MNVNDIRKMFPILSHKVYGKDLVYFDNAATMQKPNSVIEKWNKVTLEENANIHRAMHYLAEEATEEFETTRNTIKDFLGADYREEIIFTSGSTASINLVAYSFGEAFINKGDEIIISQAEHHSNIVPWQLMCERRRAKIKVWQVDDNGYLNINDLKNLISDKTKILAITEVSNVLGLVNPIKTICEICHSQGVKVLVDGSQGIVHQDVNVKNIGCDFYVFSGHKIYATSGTGVLYGKKELLEKMPPYMGGGEMISTVTMLKSTFAPLPQKFEAGTQNISGIPTLKPALDFVKLSKDKEITENYNKIKKILLEYLLNDSRINLFGKPNNINDKFAIFSFDVKNIHHQDLALILDKMGIAVRSGQVCAEPLMERFGVTGVLRASLAVYNTEEEVNKFILSLDKAIKMLQ